MPSLILMYIASMNAVFCEMLHISELTGGHFHLAAIPALPGFIIIMTPWLLLVEGCHLASFASGAPPFHY